MREMMWDEVLITPFGVYYYRNYFFKNKLKKIFLKKNKFRRKFLSKNYVYRNFLYHGPRIESFWISIQTGLPGQPGLIPLFEKYLIFFQWTYIFKKNLRPIFFQLKKFLFEIFFKIFF